MSARLAELEAKNPGFLKSIGQNAAAMGIATAMVQPMEAIDDPEHYSAMTALKEIGGGLATGAVFGTGGYVWRHLTGFPQKVEAMRTALAQIATDRPIEIPLHEWSEYRAPNLLARRQFEARLQGRQEMNIRADDFERAATEEGASYNANRAMQDEIDYRTSKAEGIEGRREFLTNQVNAIDELLPKLEEEAKKPYGEEIRNASEELRKADEMRTEALMHSGEKYGETKGVDWRDRLTEWTQRATEAKAKIDDIESRYANQIVDPARLKEIFPDASDDAKVRVSDLKQHVEDVRSELDYLNHPVNESVVRYPEQNYIPIEKSSDPVIQGLIRESTAGTYAISDFEKTEKNLADTKEKLATKTKDMEALQQAVGKGEINPEIEAIAREVERAKAAESASDLLADCLRG
jgi:hypothetical protein